jgi:hypothetical protein
MIKSTLITIIFSLLFIFEMEGQVMFQKTYGGQLTMRVIQYSKLMMVDIL